MGAEPEVVAAVQGDKPETCPMCGGRCRRPEVAGAYNRPYESLVKGEVVAEGCDEKGPYIVIRAARKENARTGGKE